MSQFTRFTNILYTKNNILNIDSVPSMNEFDTEIDDKSLLSKFHLDKVRVEEMDKMRAMRAVRTKAREQNDIVAHTSHECNHNLSQKMCIKMMVSFAEQQPTVELLSSWERNIKKLVPKKLQKKYHQTLQSYMDDTKQDFFKKMHDMSIKSIISSEFNWKDFEEPYFKFDGLTIHRPRFIHNRYRLDAKYFHSHKLIKNIFLQSYLLLPEFISDSKKYRQLGYLEPSKFFEAVEADIKKIESTIKRSYYTYIVSLVTTKRYIADVPSHLLPTFLQSASKLMTYQIMKNLMISIEHTLNVLDDWLIRPLFKLQLKCENNDLRIVPMKAEFFSHFHVLLDKISSIGLFLTPLQSWVNINVGSEFISAIIPEWFMQDCHEHLDMILERMWESLDTYVIDIRHKFGVVFSVETRNEIIAFVESDRTVEECVEKVGHFNQLIQDIDGLPENEYLTIGQVHQGDANIKLRKYAQMIREHIIQELVKQQRKFNLNLCKTFEDVTKRVLNIPNTTKELLELGEFITYATTTFTENMRQKINSMLFKMVCFIDMTTLSVDDIELNKETVNWMSKIKPIFKQCSSVYEQMKFEFEEQLQNKIVNLHNKVENMFSRLIVMNDMDDVNRIREYIEDMRQFVLSLDRMEQQKEEINMEEKLFGFPLTVFPKIDELKNEIIPYYTLIYKALKWQRDCGVWLHGPFEYLNSVTIENRTADHYTEFNKISKAYKVKIKMQNATNYPYTFSGSIDDPDPYQQPAPLKLCFQLLENVKWFKIYVPLASCFCNPALDQRHWDEMSKVAGFDLTPDAGTTLNKIINMDLMKDLHRYESISVSASKELALHELLQKIMQEWDNVQFNTLVYKNSGVLILTQLDEIQSLLEDHIVKIQAMRGSAFVKPIENEVKIFYELLLRIQKTIDEWTRVQVEWIHLLPIFSSKDIVAQLPDENVMFQNVNATFRRAMQSVGRDGRVKHTAGSLGLYESMKEANELMEKVHEGVVNYLEKKRLFFPRFFFLSNDDMLEILSKTEDPLRVQPHLRKCFEGIAKLEFNTDLEIYSMFSDDSEKIKMHEIISTSAARGCVERWLVQVEEQMVKSIKHEITMSYFDYEVTERINWVLIWPGQVVLCVSQIYWTASVQNCLMTHTISTVESLYRTLKSQMIAMVDLVKGKLTKQNRTTLNALITIDVHAQDVVKLLIDKSITSEVDFEWLAQLRYYWEDDVLVRIINATVSYAYEYLGNCPRLVITPLTDRCYRTLIGAYSLHLNGAPEGPAGTGKTETTKDLARAIAVQCVVFNCSEGLDYKNMGKFFKGLASCGAWACFDEFNRIELEVLSVIAQQILCIIQAVRAHMKTFIFEGTELELNPAVYVCITMNPGYAGRSELPDNLKVLFRTVAMMVPDYAMIGEIFLYSSGFAAARILSVKIVTTYKLCSEQLSSQSHYDYGMRAVKTVLTAAQNFKLKYPNEDEIILLLRSIIDVNLPKFLAHDIPLFKGIISDLFPDISFQTSNYDMLLKAVSTIAEQRNLQTVDGFLLKIIQTYEMMIVRHGFMLVGEPFGGKTSVLHTLADALTLMEEWGHDNGAKTIYTTINPKSITIGQLYGQFDAVSSEWTDGICAVAFREYCADESTSRKWLIFDGPVDAVWIENLNTVLDDNKKLCLTSGEVIQMTNVMSMIFEAMDLLQASPATVSRCGMIYIEPQVLGWRPFVDSWYKTLDAKWSGGHLGVIKDLFDWLLAACLDFVRKTCHVSLNAGEINQVVSTLNLYEIFLNDAVEESEDYEENIVFWIQAAMILAVVWGVGGTLDHDSLQKFNDYYIDIWRNKIEYLPMPESVLANLISLPNDGLIHDSYYTFKGKGAWKHFGDAVKIEKFIETQSIGQMVIPTIDTIKYQNLFLKLIKHRKRFLLYGDTGTGKSSYIQDIMMNKLDQEHYLPNLITFTARTTAAGAQDLVISKLFRRRKSHYGPMGGSHCVAFIDDVNMPAKEIYGAQPPIELLRQVFDHDYWYDLKEPEKIQILDTMFICAMGPPGGSRQKIYRRFLRHFNLLSINSFSDESIFQIYSNLALIGLARHGFAVSDVNMIINNFVNATSDIFKRSIADLRPTPQKSHYLFNLRDFSRVITGCTMIRKESVESRVTFTRLWVHEVLRVFGDRLVDQSDHQWLYEQLKDIIQKIMKESFDIVFDDLLEYNNQTNEFSLSNLIFGNFMDPDAIPDEKKYEEVKSIEEFKTIVLQSLEEYNTTHKNRMDIVPFRYAIEHLARVSRILAMPRGSLLMVGVGGSGRQSLTRLAANMADYALFQPEIGSAYGINEWRDDIKSILKNSGGVGKDLVFLFTEGQIKEDGFLSDIDSLLNSGEIPNLFNVEEKQEVIEMCRLAAQGGNRNCDISILSILSYFVNRCKDKLHLMLCFSPIGESFRIRLRLYPSLVNCCTIDWFEVWPEDALEQVAIRFTTDINVENQVKINAVVACKYFHVCAKEISENFYQSTGKKTYVTSAAFLDLIRTYADLMNEKQNEITLARNRYLNGLDKLAFAADQVSKMKLTLEQLRPQLETSAKLTAETMAKIEHENAVVENATVLVKNDEDAANSQAEIAGALKSECAADLATALPILEEALTALDILKPADISLIKTMKNPPKGVKLVMAAICIMLNIPPKKVVDSNTGKTSLDYWKPSKKILNDIKFLEQLKNYDKDNIPADIIQTIEKNYLAKKNFEPTIVAKASQAAKGLCKWVRAMVLYDKAIKEVAPKKEKLAAAVKDFEDLMTLLNDKRRTLKELNDKLRILKDSLQDTLEKKIDLENQVENCRNKLNRATKLISGLGGEKNRWLQTAHDLQSSYETLPGDILISCGMIAYLGPYTTLYRVDNVEKWRQYVKNLNIPCSDSFAFVKVLGSDIKINSWNIFGLPRDSFSIENAIIMNNSKRWSLFIDPQSQANKWIKNMEKLSELEVLKLTDKNYMTIFEQSIEYGKPVLIENIGEELDAPLDPILSKNIYKVANDWYITLGEKVVQYDNRFRLYMTTKFRNPHYLPEVFNKVTVVNFALTIDGLEDQLLGIVVAKEHPDLQEKREYLIVQSATNRKALEQVENNILRTLSSSGTAILEDEEAIGILDSSKILSVDIIKKQESSKETEKKIDIFRQSYRPFAKHSSSLYYTLTDLPNIDPMYQYSLSWFINLYAIAIDTANKSKTLERRLMFLRDTFTYILYRNVCRSLFEKDQLLYSFILYTTILLATDTIDKDELMFFLSGGVAIEQSGKKPAVDWLSDRCWDEICRVDQLKTFKEFPNSFCSDLTSWKIFYDSINPEISSIPQPWENKLTDFEKLIVMRIIRPDKVTLKVRQFVEAGMGEKFVIPPPFDISKFYADSNCLIPLIFILSPGSDPMSALTNYAEKTELSSSFHSISLGQGQGPIAKKLIEQAQIEGSWVCLQNCHLAVSWMSELEKICEDFDSTNTSINFRLWLTSYPSDKFPISVLQNGVKMTNEPPMGLQQNLMRSYTSEPVKNPEFFLGCPGKENTFSKLLYSLCFFHALVQERRNYSSQGWNIKYGFNESDFQISVYQLQIFINEYKEVPFKAILYLTGECNYGGRVTDDRDRRCLMTILQDFYNENVIENENYHFSTVASEYGLPKKFEYHDYIKEIEAIPMNPPPEVFGLHMNAGITRDLEVSRIFFDSMMKIQGPINIGETSKQDKLLLSMKKNIYERLPNLFDLEGAQKIYPIDYMESMNTVLIQEMARYNVLLLEIRESLEMLEKAMLGLTIMSPDLEILSQHILHAKIPPTWIKASAYPSLKSLPSFINDFLQRLNFFYTWLNNGKPKTFWIAGFSFVHAFLTGAMQNFSRKYKISIDKIDFDFEIMPAYKLNDAPIDGVYTYGMYLVGGRWDMATMTLMESQPKILWELMPIVWFKPSQMTLLNICERFECPLYITSARFGTLKTTGHSTNYILMILLDTKLPISHWIKRGLALLCQLDD